MANAKISALSSATTPLAGTEVVPIVQTSTKKVTVDNLTAGKAVPMLSMTPGSPNAIGVNVTPNNWLSGYIALEFAYGAIQGSGSQLMLLNNAYRNTSGNWTYKNSAAANLLALDSGAYYFYNAASGTAGNTFSWTTIGAMGSGGMTTSGTLDPFGRGYSKIVASNGGSGASAVCVNAATGNAAFVDLGVNGTRSGSLYGDATTFEVAAIGASVPMYLTTNGNYRVIIETGGDFRPASNDAINLGNGTARWKEVFAINGTINTSDARLKTAVTPLSDSEIAAAQDIAAEIGTFQWLDSVEKKGADKARHHAGVTVQRVMEIMQSHGLEPTKYAFICYDEWQEDAKEVEDENGDIVKEFEVVKTVTKEVEKQEVKVIDGRAILQTVKTLETEQVVQPMPVVDEAGQPVMIDSPEQRDDEGNMIVEASKHPMMHYEPVMEKITKRFKRVVMNPAGNCYALRHEQLLMFIVRGLLQKTM